MGIWSNVGNWFTEERGPDASQYGNTNAGSGQISAGLQGLAELQRQQQFADTGRGDQFRAGQLGLMGQLQGVASGQQMGAGEMAAARAGAQGRAALQSQAAGARGFGAQAARAALGRQQALMSGQVAGQQAQAALGDQASALGQLGGLMQGARGQDQQTSLANLQAGLQQQQQEDQRRLAALGQMSQNDMAGQQLRLQAEGMQQPKRWEQLLGGATQLAGNVLAKKLGG